MTDVKVKPVNYTAEQTALIIEGHRAGQSNEQLAELIGKTVRSVAAKLARELKGEYKKKEYKTKTGEAPIKKDDQADAIGAILNMSEAETGSLAKANKTALRKILLALANSKPV